jgi:alkylation response protein AidB-like acyl-CoA dehydrogenase
VSSRTVTGPADEKGGGEWIPEPYRTAERLEQYLGDPLDPECPFSFQRVLEFDEREEFPEPILRFVRGSELDSYLVPTELGGRFDSCEGHFARHRSLARRDFSVDIAIGASHLAFLPVWCAGSPAQRARFARAFFDHELAALALTEREHGSDLVRSEVVATRVAGGWSLSGEKWLVNNASLGRLVCVLTKTEGTGTRPSLSLFLVDKDEVAPGSYAHIPKIRLHGTRAMDVCGIRFDGCQLSDAAVVGGVGGGIEPVLKGFAFSRTMCTAMSVAAADTALRTTLAFARTRRLYGDTVLSISHARHQLAYCFADLLLCECIAIASARALHVIPEQAALTAAIAKYLVPVTCERIVEEAGAILGARHYLREEHWHGIFQKVRRDNELISLFDGSTIVNLSSVASQLGALAVGRRERRTEVRDRARALFRLDEPLPRFRFEAIALSCAGRNDVLEGLADLERAIGSSPHVSGGLQALLRALAEELVRLEEHLQEGFRAGWATKHRSAEAIELARRYCVLHGLAMGCHVWFHDRELLGRAFERGDWLVVAGWRLLASLRGTGAPCAPVDISPIVDEMLRLFDERRAFSIVPYQLAGS